MQEMKLWLDDARPPHKYGCAGWTWAKTYEEAVAALESGRVTEASLDHDLSEMATIGQATPGEKTGYHVIRWMEEHGVWPVNGVVVHSMNPVGARRMVEALVKRYGGHSDEYRRVLIPARLPFRR